MEVISNACPECGAIMTEMDGQCPMCSANALAERVQIGEDQLKKREQHKRARAKRSDAFKMLESQVTLTKDLQAELRKQMNDMREFAKNCRDISDKRELAVVMEKFTRTLTTVGNQAAKIAKEQLGWIEAKNKIAEKMTSEERMATIQKWFVSLPKPSMIYLHQRLASLYNEEMSRRTAKSATKKKASS